MPIGIPAMNRPARLGWQLGFGTVIVPITSAPSPGSSPGAATALVEGLWRRCWVVICAGASRPGCSDPPRVMTSSGALQSAELLLAKDTILSALPPEWWGRLQHGRRDSGCSGARLRHGWHLHRCFLRGAVDDAVLRELQSQTEIAGLTLLAERLPIETVAAGGGSVLTSKVPSPGWGRDPPGAAWTSRYRAGGPLTITDANLLLGGCGRINFSVFGER